MRSMDAVASGLTALILISNVVGVISGHTDKAPAFHSAVEKNATHLASASATKQNQLHQIAHRVQSKSRRASKIF